MVSPSLSFSSPNFANAQTQALAVTVCTTFPWIKIHGGSPPVTTSIQHMCVSSSVSLILKIDLQTKNEFFLSLPRSHHVIISTLFLYTTYITIKSDRIEYVSSRSFTYNVLIARFVSYFPSSYRRSSTNTQNTFIRFVRRQGCS